MKNIRGETAAKVFDLERPKTNLAKIPGLWRPMNGATFGPESELVPWIPLREEMMRARDRARVQQARSNNRPMWLFALLAGPGILVMLGENDGPSMLSYATTGAAFGVGFFLPFIVVTFALAYIVQEMVVRIGIATRRGSIPFSKHAASTVGNFLGKASPISRASRPTVRPARC